MKILGIIPSRYASTRFPGKPLSMIGSKTMIQRVYIQAKKAFEDVVVATDDDRIFNHVKNFGGQVVMTNENHQSGTDRCAEALEKYSNQINKKFDVVVNIQGDEPFVNPQQLTEIGNLFEDSNVEIATIVKPIKNIDEIFNENAVKVVLNVNNYAIYFSRSPIPFMRNKTKEEWLNNNTFYHHIGVYAYKTDVLAKITKLPQSILEICEKLEQNRWIENCYKIKVCKTEAESFSVDTPEDLQNILKNMKLD